MADLYKYGVAVHIYKPIIKRGAVDFAVGADWTPAAGDVKISKDGGAAANVTNLPTAIVMGNTAMWDFSLTATEMQAGKINITVSDAPTEVVEDVMFELHTYGNASAQHAIDLGTIIENQVWDALRSSHVLTGSMGLLHRGVISDGTATAGTASSITLAGTEPTTVDVFRGAMIAIYAGTGAGQAPRMISAYSAGRVATVVPDWTVTPDNTSKYIIHAFADPVIVGADNKVILSSAAHTGAVIPSVTSIAQIEGVDATNQIRDAILSDATPFAGGNINATISSRLAASAYSAPPIAHSGTAQSGSTSSSIILAAGASASDNFYNRTLIYIKSGTGAGQARVISGYTGASKTAVLMDDWITTPDNTSVYDIYATNMPPVTNQGGVSVATNYDKNGYILDAAVSPYLTSNAADGGAASTITLNSGSSATDNFYKNRLISIYGGTGQGQSRIITSYNGTTKVATVNRAWDVVPVASDSQYQIFKYEIESADLATMKNVITALPFKKNTAVSYFPFIMTDSTTNAAKTGISNASFTKKYRLDNGSAGNLGGTITEVDATNFPGLYSIDLSAGEMNGDMVELRFAASGANDLILTVRTNP